jgi:hypothetical protein
MVKRVFALIMPVAIILVFAATGRAQDPVGEWNLQSDAQGQVTKFVLTVTKEGEVLKGKIASETYGNQTLGDFKFEAGTGTITYTRNLDVGGQVIPLLFKGKIEGDKLTGVYTVEGVEIPVTGTRKKPDATGGK